MMVTNYKIKIKLKRPLKAITYKKYGIIHHIQIHGEMTKAKAHTVGVAGHLVTTALPSEWGERGLTWGRPVPPSLRRAEGALGAGAQECVWG